MGECFIVRRGGEANKLPVLNPSLPANVSVVEAAGAYADFSVEIDEPGVPAEYTYTWYLDGSKISGETGANVRILGLTSEAVHSVYCTVANRAGLVRSRTAVLTVESCLPQLSYTGQSEVVDDGDYNWRVKFLTSGNVTFNRAPGNVDVFLVGGGANPSEYDGGGSGYTQTYYAVQLDAEKYQVEIGSAGGTTNAFGCSAEGGSGVNGGCGGGRYAHSGYAGVGGTDGGNGGGNGSNTGGSGQGRTTREFEEANGTLYGGGGGGSGTKGTIGGQYYDTQGAYGGDPGGGDGLRASRNRAPVDNTGGGGGGATAHTGASGIVVIRNHR